MGPSREHRVFEILEGALERAPEKRLQFVLDRCRGDVDLRDAVLALVAATAKSRAFLEVDRRRGANPQD